MPNSLPSLLLCCYYSSDVGSRGHAFGDNKINFYSEASRYDQVTFGYTFYVTSADATPASGDHLGTLVEDNCDGSLENVKGGRIHTNLAGKHVEGGSSQKPGIIDWEKEERHYDSQQEAKREGVRRMCHRTATTQLILPDTALGSSSCDGIITWAEHNHDVSYSWRIHWVCGTRRVCVWRRTSSRCLSTFALRTCLQGGRQPPLAFTSSHSGESLAHAKHSTICFSVWRRCWSTCLDTSTLERSHGSITCRRRDILGVRCGH